MANYFNSLPLRLQLEQLGVCEFMDQSELIDGITALKEKKKVVIVGCGAQGLNQGLNMRDQVRYLCLRAEAIAQKSFFMNAAG
jgi:ketol-acid reductoisomerase